MSTESRSSVCSMSTSPVGPWRRRQRHVSAPGCDDASWTFHVFLKTWSILSPLNSSSWSSSYDQFTSDVPVAARRDRKCPPGPPAAGQWSSSGICSRNQQAAAREPVTVCGRCTTCGQHLSLQLWCWLRETTCSAPRGLVQCGPCRLLLLAC